MGFQSTVNYKYTRGFVGEPAADVPRKVRPWRLSTQTSVANTVGKAFTYSADNTVSNGNQGSQVAAVGGTGIFAGILVNPKHYALYGTSAGGSLAASLDLPASSEVELMMMGNIIVYLPTAANYGDNLYFVQADGTLGVGTASAGQTQITGAKVLNSISAAGLTVIALTE